MKHTVIALAAGFALMSSFALAQTAGSTAEAAKAGGTAATAPRAGQWHEREHYGHGHG